MEKRVSRLAFNTNGWVLPSGPYGKSDSPDSYEAQFGFGHEEWLFDISKLIDGYHYGFLEPVRKQLQAYAGNTYDVWLYTIDRKSKKRFWIGEINNLRVLTKAEADRALDEYKRRGWHLEMRQQVEAIGGDINAFLRWHDVDLFNVRFKPEDLKVNDPYVEIPTDHPVIKMPRYNFTHFWDDFKILVNQGFAFQPDKDSQPASPIPELHTKTYMRESRAVELENLLAYISHQLIMFLKLKYGSRNVKAEHLSGSGGSRMDIVVNSGDEGFIFYEIKTYNSLKTSIREAIGQLLEYSYFPENQNASSLVILTQKHSGAETVEVIRYIRHIRSKFGIPVYYQWYDYQNNVLSEKF